MAKKDFTRSPKRKDKAEDINWQALDFEPVLTEEYVQKFEADYNKSWGVDRRLAFITLARSRTQLLDGFGKDENGIDSLLDIIDRLRALKEHLEKISELAATAQARLFCTAHVLMQRGQNHG